MIKLLLKDIFLFKYQTSTFQIFCIEDRWPIVRIQE